MRDKIYRILEYIGEYSIYALIFFIPTAKAAIEIFFGFALFSFVIRKILKPDFNFLKTLPNLFLLFFFIFMGLSLFNSGPYLQKGLIALFFKWLKYIAVYVVVQDTFSKRIHLRNAIIVFLFIATVVSIDGLTQKLFNIEFMMHHARPVIRKGVFAASGPFSYYNNLGTYLIYVLALTIALLFSPKLSKNYRNILILTGTLALFCLISTFSRGAMFGFFVAIIFMLLLSRNTKVTIPVVVIFMLMILLIPTIRDRILHTIAAGGDPIRYKIWGAAFVMIREHPFLGKGVGTFMNYFPQYIDDLGKQYAHNCYLQIWVETGIFSLLAFLAFIYTFIIKAARYFIRFKDFLVLGLLCGSVGFLAHSFLDTQLYSLQLAFLFWLMMGLLSAAIIHQHAD